VEVKSKAPLKLALYKGEWLASCLTKTAPNTPSVNTVRTPEVVSVRWWRQISYTAGSSLPSSSCVQL